MSFKPGKSGNPAGKPPGTKGWFTLAREQLRQVVPDAIEHVKKAVQAGDMDAIKLLFAAVLPPQRAAYPLVAIDIENQSPRAVLAAVKSAISAGTIAVDHANAILDLLTKVKRLETGIMLAEKEVIEATPLETAQAVITTVAQNGDLETVLETTRTALPYTAPRPEPLPPVPTGTVSADPIELTPEEWEAKYGNYA